MAYDGAKSLYTVGPLPQKSFEFTVFLEESAYRRYYSHKKFFSKHSNDYYLYVISLYRAVASAGSSESPNRAAKMSKHSFRPQIFIVHIIYAAEVSLNPIFVSPQGLDVKGVHDGLRVLDVVLRQKLVNQLNLLITTIYLHDLLLYHEPLLIGLFVSVCNYDMLGGRFWFDNLTLKIMSRT